MEGSINEFVLDDVLDLVEKHQIEEEKHKKKNVNKRDPNKMYIDVNIDDD